MTKEDKLKKLLELFDCSHIDYEPTQYISFSAMGREDGSHSFQLVFAYKNKNKIKSKPVIIKEDKIAFIAYQALTWGRRVTESSQSEFAEMILSAETTEPVSGW